MNTYSIYRLDSGLFTGSAYTCAPHHLEENVPDGCSCIVGVYDSLSQKIDLDSGRIVDHIPPKSSDNHSWDKETKRWIYQNTDEDMANVIKTKRHALLLETDWLSIRSLDGIEIPDEWKAYRADLRNITKQEGFPRNVVWPSIPRQAT